MAHLVAVILVAAFAFVGFRQVLAGAAGLLLVSAFVLVASVLVYRLLTCGRARQHSQTGIEANLDWLCASNPFGKPSREAQPLTTSELLQKLRSIDWFQFEQVIALLYSKQGYAVTRRGGANPDGGIDVVIEKAGTRTAVQCKHWKTWNVGVKAVREFLGALTDSGIQKGIFITLRGYTGDAKHLAEKHGIELLNETGLVQMLEAAGALHDPSLLQILSDTRKLCPKCEREMVLRTATKGPGTGERFWGCSGFPRCRYVMPATEKLSLS